MIRMLLALHITWLLLRTTKARDGHLVMKEADFLLRGGTATAEMTGETVKGGVPVHEVLRQGLQTRVTRVWWVQ